MSRTMLIAGGGTGGHLFPGVAVARTLKRMHPDMELVFVGAGRALESRALEKEGFALEILNVKAFRGKGPLGRITSILGMIPAVMKARALLKKYRPGLVLAVGGYAAVPLGIAAKLAGLPLAVQEQNTVPGLTNKILGKWARVIFTAFDEAEKFFDPQRVQLMGNPVRPELLERAEEVMPGRPGPAERFNLLVVGGSQGAHTLNVGVSRAMQHLHELKHRLNVQHQTGADDLETVRKAYADAGVEAEVGAFFDDMGAAYANAHLVICRSGAMTVSELTALGRASICVPFPHAVDDHQTKNAASLVKAGAAELVPDMAFKPETAAKMINELADDPGKLSRMESLAATLGKKNAADRIARACLELMGVN
jgi:UDP-N-acetylglucosamine--N-acetylmuramyl-(pentapeptide) pyrophosphoryl-undecaprenol N-acetylglucosamine transferase